MVISGLLKMIICLGGGNCLNVLWRKMW